MRKKFADTLCGKGLFLWYMIISGLFWLVLIIILNGFYKINMARFERNVGSLKIGISETEITSILGKPQYTKRVTYFRPTDEAVPPTANIVEYFYIKGFLQVHEIGGIYIDSERGTLVRLYPYRQPVFFLGASPESHMVIFLFSSMAATAIVLWLICRRRALKSGKRAS